MGQVLFLSGGEVNVVALRKGMGLHLHGFGGIVMDLYIIHSVAGEMLDSGFEFVGQAGAVFLLLKGVKFSLQEFPFLYGRCFPLNGGKKGIDRGQAKKRRRLALGYSFAEKSGGSRKKGCLCSFVCFLRVIVPGWYVCRRLRFH